jgi:hypothetical protein
MAFLPDYYALLGVHPTTDEFVVRLAHKARRQELEKHAWQHDHELRARLDELEQAEATLTDPERHSAYYVASGGEKNHTRQMVIELDLFDNLFSEIQRKLEAAANKRLAVMTELQKLEYSRRRLASESIMAFFTEEHEQYATTCNFDRNRSELRKLVFFREHADVQIKKTAHETRLLALRTDWVALGISEDILKSAPNWISAERNAFKNLSGIGIRRTKLWLERIRSEIRRQLTNSVCCNDTDFWTDAPATFDDSPEFSDLDTLLYKAGYSIARAEYRPEESKETCPGSQ